MLKKQLTFFIFLGLPLCSHGALVAHYQFDEATGATSAANAVAGSTNGAVGANVITGLTGISGNAYGFSGSAGQQDIVDMENASFFAAINAAGAYTLSAWVNTSEASGNRNVAVFAGNAGDSNDYADLGTSQDTGHPGEAYARNRPNTNSAPLATGFFSDGTPVIDGTWHHLAMTVSLADSLITLYVDGFVANTQTIPDSSAVFPSFNNFEIGRLGRSAPTDGYEGLIDDVQVYDEALNASQLSFLTNNPGQVVPEPAVFSLAGLSLLSLLCRRRA